jgi:hypothetical protein
VTYLAGATLSLAFLIFNFGTALAEDRSEKLARLLITLCVGGGSATISRPADGTIVIGSAAGDNIVERREASGLIDGISSALNALQAQQANRARECMKPFVQKIMDLVLSGPEEKVDDVDVFQKLSGTWCSDVINITFTLLATKGSAARFWFGTNEERIPKYAENLDLTRNTLVSPIRKNSDGNYAVTFMRLFDRSLFRAVVKATDEAELPQLGADPDGQLKAARDRAIKDYFALKAKILRTYTFTRCD